MAENAIYQDFSNVFLIEGGFQLEERSPERAGEILARIGAENSFTLYEYFITDKIGHDQNFEAARRTLPLLARFVRSLLERTDLQRTTVILTSDHGNVEDLSTRNHTLNKVPTLVWGKDRFQIADKIGSLSDISPAVLAALTLSTVE
jgi:bisphosphoglycerate-independent phosphoglycerate mutase (AlkP superfamily)